MNKRYKQKELKKFLQNNKVSLAGLIETRVKENNTSATINSIAAGWKCFNNYKDIVNIWIIWDDSWYDVKLIASSAQMIHCYIQERSKGYQFNLTVVYGFNTIEQRKNRLAGAPINENEIKDFSNCVKVMGINELQWKGNYYTWNNKQSGNARISSRIDRAFGNDAWMDKWGHVILKYGNPGVSDHSPMQLMLHQGYQQIEDARTELAEVQNQLGNQAKHKLVGKEKELLTKLEKWSMLEENALRQKARAKWIKLGYENNKYFSSVIKERNNKKSIRSLMSLDGRMLHEPQ
nr:uncharacterized protein LOC104644632 [Solanum lycopersicum]